MKIRFFKLPALMIVIFLAASLTSCSKKGSGTGDTTTTTPTTPEGSSSTDSNIDDLMALSSGSTYSTKTSLGVHFQSLSEATSDQLTWLNDATKEPAVPKGKESTLTMLTSPVTLYPYGDPSPADCNQTALGDCSAISIFAELAYTNPSFIKSIIKDNGNSTYTVSMYSPNGTPIKVTVSNKFMSNLSNGTIVAVTGKSQIPTWSTVMEKALMKYIEVYKLVQTIEGIGSEYASPPFTGDG
ncbi:MAG: hypothetical protein DI598_18915, partial [Pseudopedobacter saltans]